MIHSLPKLLFFLLLSISFLQCRKGPPDGQYCARITFKSAETGKMVKYKLLVAVKDNELIAISFPAGHYDTTAIMATPIAENGTCTVQSGMRQLYQITMEGPAEKCLTASNQVQCLGHSRDGKRCKRSTDSPTGYCWQHQDQRK